MVGVLASEMDPCSFPMTGKGQGVAGEERTWEEIVGNYIRALSFISFSVSELSFFLQVLTTTPI